ncbi:MAG: ribose-phosphate diphosphokinase [bacterium]
MLIFAGRYGKTLGKSLTAWKKAREGEYTQSYFKNGERRIKILTEVKGEEVWVVQDMAKNADAALVELLLLIDAMKEMKAKKITAAVPFMAYSFQNRKFEGEPISARVIARTLSASGADEIILVDLHEKSILAHFTIPVKNISTTELFAEEIKKLELGKEVCVVAPDKGSAGRAERLSKLLGLPIVRVNKERDRRTLEVGGLKIVEGKLKDTCLLIDDAVNSGRTVVEVSKWLRKKGAKKIVWLVTHFMSVEGSLEMILPTIDLLITTNSCEHGLKVSSKVKIIELTW